MPQDSQRHLLITGCTGYIGSRVVSLALQRGYRLTLLSRSKPEMESQGSWRWFAWNLTDDVPAKAFMPDAGFGPVDAVIHAAHQWTSDKPESENENIVGAGTLCAAVRTAGIRRLVVTSTVSASGNALNQYGRIRAAVEALLNGPNEIAARIGLIYGGPQVGQWATLCGIVQKLPILPMIGLKSDVQPIHLDEVCEGLIRLATVPDLKNTLYVLAAGHPLAFGKFLKSLARHRFGRNLRLIPIPLTLALLMTGVVNVIPFLPRIDKERILGLAGLPTLESEPGLQELGLKLIPLADRLVAEMPGRRRRLIAEGTILLRYIAGARPRMGMVIKYVRGVERFAGGRPAVLPGPPKWCPALMALWEPVGADVNSELWNRAQLALQVADASGDSGFSAYDYRGDGVLKSLWRFLVAAVTEVLLLPVRLILGRSR